jgi:NifU-like protein involved in Fe-S cluster formation
MYSQQVISHFENPRNVGDLSNAHASVRVENPACGDIMELSLRLASDNAASHGALIEDARFRIRGCVTSIACGSVLTEMLRGKSVAEARKIQRKEVVDALGGLTNETMHGSYLVMDALAAALSKLTAVRKV